MSQVVWHCAIYKIWAIFSPVDLQCCYIGHLVVVNPACCCVNYVALSLQRFVDIHAHRCFQHYFPPTAWILMHPLLWVCAMFKADHHRHVSLLWAADAVCFHEHDNKKLHANTRPFCKEQFLMPFSSTSVLVLASKIHAQAPLLSEPVWSAKSCSKCPAPLPHYSPVVSVQDSKMNQ